MPLICCTNVFFQGQLSRHITSHSEKTRPESWSGNYMGKAAPVWQLSLSHRCHQMQRTAEPKPQQTPSVEKHALPLRVVYCAIYTTLTRFIKFRVRNLHITSTQYAANTLHQHIFPRAAIPSHFKARTNLRVTIAFGGAMRTMVSMLTIHVYVYVF